MMNKIIEILIEHEGIHLKPYLDSKGVTTIGIGTAETRGLYEDEKLLLGVESIHELTEIDKKTAIWLASNEVCVILNKLEKLDWYRKLPEYIQLAITELCYNFGISGFMNFTKTIQYLKEGKYEDAGIELLDSNYFKDVKGRALRIAILISTGKLIDIENARWLYKILQKRLD